MIIYFHSLLVAFLLILFHIAFVLFLMRKTLATQISPVFIHVISGFVALAFLGLAGRTPFSFDGWLTFSFFGFASTSFLFLFSAVYKSLSLRFLLTIRSNRNRLTFSQLHHLVTKKSFKERAELLSKMGMVIKKGEDFSISSQGLRVAKRIEQIRKIFGITTRGLYQELNKDRDDYFSQTDEI